MSSSTNSLNSVKESVTAELGLDLTKNRFQQFTFSKQLERNELAKSFEQKAPSPLVTALNVTKIAPAVFFVLEKLAAALEALLNGSISLLNSAYSAVLGSHEIVVLDLTQEPKSSDNSSATSAIDEMVVSVEESVDPSSAKTSDIDQGDVFVGEDASADDIAQLSPATTTPKNDLDSYSDLLIDVLKDDSTALPPAPSHTLRNLVIGGGIGAAALATGYIAASYFNYLPDSLNIFGSNETNDPSSTGLEENLNSNKSLSNSPDEESKSTSNENKGSVTCKAETGFAVDLDNTPVAYEYEVCDSNSEG